MKGYTKMEAYERLIKYTSYPTASDESNESCPSTPEQITFAHALADELKEIGASDVTVDENGYVFAEIPSNIDKNDIPVIGFIAHMDVVDDVEFRNVKPKIIKNYDGKDIVLNEELNIIMKASEYETLSGYIGCDLVVTDGTTLLGADDKAGIAEIMTMAEILCSDDSIKHGKIKIGFTPDEEIGRGADLFDVEKFGADFAYTADGGAFGEVEYETFNAASATVTIAGKSIHPGAAKDKMINASIVAAEYISLLPPLERPEHTCNYEGFYHVTSIDSTVDRAVIKIIIRDHNENLLEMKKQYAIRAAHELNKKYPPDTVNVIITDSYRNMKEMILTHKFLIEKAYEAVSESGGTPVSIPIRGGTDGSRLSFMGLPCPNLGTGSHNHHGKYEYAIAQEMQKATQCLIKIAEKFA